MNSGAFDVIAVLSMLTWSLHVTHFESFKVCVSVRHTSCEWRTLVKDMVETIWVSSGHIFLEFLASSNKPAPSLITITLKHQRCLNTQTKWNVQFVRSLAEYFKNLEWFGGRHTSSKKKKSYVMPSSDVYEMPIYGCVWYSKGQKQCNFGMIEL